MVKPRQIPTNPHPGTPTWQWEIPLHKWKMEKSMELIANFHDFTMFHGSAAPQKWGAPFNPPKAMTPPIQLRKMRLSALAKGSPRAGYPLPIDRMRNLVSWRSQL